MRRFILKALLWTATPLVAVLASAPLFVPPLVERVAEGQAAARGFPVRVRMSMRWSWRNGPGCAGRLEVSADGPWRLTADFGASCSEWEVAARMAETRFSERDAMVRRLLDLVPLPGVTNLAFSGSVALQAKAVRTFSTPVPVWSVKVPVRNFSLSCAMDGQSVEAEGFSVTPAASGVAEHVDIAPLFVRGKSVTASGFELTDVRASVLANERRLLVTEASAALCGGTVSVYSLHLDMKSLNAGFALFVDDVDSGQVLAHLRDFEGRARGRLHGKVKLRLRALGESVRISDAFLYSTPGEVGKLQLEDTAGLSDHLAMAGLDEATRRNVAEVMTDVDYSVLKFDLSRGEGRTATLTTRLVGSATRGKLTVPVDLTLNVNGEIEQLLNLWLGCSRKMKGNSR